MAKNPETNPAPDLSAYKGADPVAAPVPAPAPAPAVQAKGSRETVIVGCKLPHGLLIDLRDRDGVAHRIKLAGSAKPVLATQHRPAPLHQIAGAAGLTTVDKEMFDRWMEEHRTYEPVLKGMIFATSKLGDTIAEAKNRQSDKTGFEPSRKPKKGEKIEPRTDD